MLGQFARSFHHVLFGACVAPVSREAPGERESAPRIDPERRDEPFHCAEFSITARRLDQRDHEPEWLVDVRGVEWDALFVLPNRRGDRYEEAAFRKVAALSGWRLATVVAAGERQRRLYFERGQINV